MLMGYRESDNLPAVPDHAHPLRLGNPVELGRLLQILLAPDALGVAVTRLGKRIHIAPRYPQLVLDPLHKDMQG